MPNIEWKLKSGLEAKISFAGHGDNRISTHLNGEVIEQIILFNCGAVDYFPSILHYCFINNVDLTKNKFLNALKQEEHGFLNEHEEDDFKYMLMEYIGKKRMRVFSDAGKLSLRSNFSSNITYVVFNKDDVPELVENIIKHLNDPVVPSAYDLCVRRFCHYQNNLNDEKFKHLFDEDALENGLWK